MKSLIEADRYAHRVPAPIIELLRMIRDNRWPIVALLEFEHGTLRPEVEEVDLMFDYCKRAVA